MEDDAVQLSWGALPSGEVQVDVDGRRAVVVAPEDGPGGALVCGLEADQEYVATVTAADDVRRLPFRSLAPPPGELLCRLATISDLHLGTDRFGMLGWITELPEPVEAHPVRCTRAAMVETVEWGAEHLIVKGDVTDESWPENWETFGELLADLPIPVDVIVGNHDTGTRRTIEPAKAMAELGLHPIEDVRSFDLPGVRVVLADTTVNGCNRGRVHHLTEEVCERLADADGPALLVLHHYLQSLPFPTFAPAGIASHRAGPFLHAVASANPATLVTSGHSHRHRTRRSGPLVLSEVGSPKDYPGTWAGYAVHEGGIRQVVRRVIQPDCIGWTEYTRRAGLGLWGWWSPGRLEQRCFTHPWPTR